MSVEHKIVNCSVNDDTTIQKLLNEGFTVEQAVTWTERFYEDKTKYTQTGQTYYEKVLNYEQNMIKYILRRDSMTRLLHG